MNLCHLFDCSLRGRAGHTAIEFRDSVYTFGDLEIRSNRLAHLFLLKGMKAGDRLGIYLKNCVEVVSVLLACLKIGVIFVPINVHYRDDEITHILANTQPFAFITDVPTATYASVWNPFDLSSESENQPGSRPIANIDGDWPAAIIHTSGTSGNAKGVVLTHNNLATNALNLLACWQINHADRFLLALPLFHAHGLAHGLMCELLSGCQMRLLDRFDYRTAVQAFVAFQPTLFFGTPTMYVRLLSVDPPIAREIGLFMRLFVSGSAPLSVQAVERFRELFGHRILDRYGTTETLMAISNPYIGDRRPGTIGLPLPGVSVQLLNAELRPVPDGEMGELYLKGNLFAGYWRHGAVAPDILFDGYYRTQDFAKRTVDGYYILCGRSIDLIISGGFNISAYEIEEFLLTQPGILEAAVVGKSDELCGEVPVAYLVVNGPVDVSSIAAKCGQHLASFKVPHEFIVVDALPRNAMGKIQKNLLQTNRGMR